VIKIIIYPHFSEKKESYLIFSLNDGDYEKMLVKLPGPFREFYISNSKLEESIEKLKVRKQDILQDYIPTEPIVMSGEFAEIFSTHFLIERYFVTDGIQLFHPSKLFWKEAKNKAIHFTDVILFSNTNPQMANENDLLISGEIKSKATKNDLYDPVQDATSGVISDKLSRLVETLEWIKEKYTQDMNKEGIECVNRYRYPYIKTYRKHYKGFVLIDKALLEAEVTKKRTPKIKETKRVIKKIRLDLDLIGATVEEERIINFNDVTEETINRVKLSNRDLIMNLFRLATLNFEEPCEIIIVSMENLKKAYETVYEKIVE